MWLILTRPDFSRTCDGCIEWLYDEEPASETYGQIKKWNGEPIKRPAGSTTPCDRCPKCEGSKVKSPEVGRKAELSDKNHRTWELYERQQSSGGIGAALDPIQRKNFGILHQVFRAFERRQQNRIAGAIEGLLGVKR